MQKTVATLQEVLRLPTASGKTLGLFGLYKNIDEILQQFSKSYQEVKEETRHEKTNLRKHLGAYYTHPEIAEKIVVDTLSDFKDKELVNLKFYEPCVGLGIFVYKYLDYIFSVRNIETKYLQIVLDNLYFSDIDHKAVDLVATILPIYVKQKYGVDVKFNQNNSYKGDVLFKKEKGIQKNNPLKIFNLQSGFDVVITNPPYRLLKANSNKYEQKDETAEIVDFIKKNKIYKYNEGTLNLYKLFVEEILENYTHQKSSIGLLIPQTILNDLQSEKLRKKILEYKLSTIFIMPEQNKYFPDITQSFCFFSLNKGSVGQNLINIIPEVVSKENINSKPISVDLELLKSVSSNLPIFSESRIGWNILKKLQKSPKLSSHLGIKNLRGELDVTLHKSYITQTPTSFKLVRGSNIKEYQLNSTEDYVKEEFLNIANGKGKYIKMERLGGQQISNISSKKRLKFAKIPPSYILGNSCNFIAVETNLFKNAILDIDYLLLILNSFLLDWRFKLTSSNNHVNNYELADLPIHVPNETEIKKLRSLRNKRAELEEYILDIYGLAKEEKEYILNKY